jgi:cation diffusion facilitator CzcD-associated flavoprotein CzcO
VTGVADGGTAEPVPETEHFVGAGISGVGAAYHLTRQCPGTRFVVLEVQPTFGGTWITHRFPGIRSDSDLYTFGYRFKPWTGAPIATAAEILKYMGEVIDENDIGRYIRYRHRIDRASWSSADNRWTIDAMRTDTGEARSFTASFFFMCQGYYRHVEGYTPEWEGIGDFAGRIVHPQTWPADLDYRGQRVVVIGSGATAATMIPAMAADCAHITMLQRSPTYFRIGRNAIEIADELRRLQVDPAWIHEIVRRKILYEQAVFTRRCASEPEAGVEESRAGNRLPRRLKEGLAFAVSVTSRSAFGAAFHGGEMRRLGVGTRGILEVLGVTQMFSSYTKIADTLQLEPDMGHIAPVDPLPAPGGRGGGSAEEGDT